MKFLENKRARTFLFIFLAAANIVTLGALWYTLYQNNVPVLPPSRQGSAEQHPDVMGYLCNRLELDNAQAAEFERLRQKHFAKVQNLNGQSGALRRRIFDEIFQAEPDTAQIRFMTKELGILSQKKEQYTAEHFMGLAKTCTIKQSRMLRRIIDRTSRRFMGYEGRSRQQYNKRHGRYRSKMGKGSTLNLQRRKKQ